MTTREPRVRNRTCRAAALAWVACVLTIAAVPAADGAWSFEVAPVYMQVYGHDQQVLSVHRFDFGAPSADAIDGVHLDTDEDLSYRARFEAGSGDWRWGAGFLWVRAPQGVGDRGASADGSDLVIYETADRSYASSTPGETLFFRVLEDTTIEMWTADLYALRTLAETPATRLALQLGLKVGDFDNDYRAAVGIEGVAGTRLDASSNYDRMMGPLVGLFAELELGSRSSFEGYLGQSVLIGSVELTSVARDFTGAFSEMPDPVFFNRRSFRTERDVAIPVTELELRWSYRLSDRFTLFVGSEATVWWDVPVPPAVVPNTGPDALHENTLVFVGALAGLRWTI